MIQFDREDRRLRLGVGDLVRYGSETVLREMPAQRSRLIAGVREHGEWRSEVEATAGRELFAAEVPVEYRAVVRGHEVVLEGRVDGLHVDGGSCVVEEVKTIIVPPGSFDADALRSAVESGRAHVQYRFQLEIYLLMVSRTSPWKLLGEPQPETNEPNELELVGRLIFRNLAVSDSASRHVTVEVEPDLDSVRERVHERLEEILSDLLERQARREEVATLGALLPFPFASLRSGQAELEDAARQTLERDEHLLLSAPPGIGKTAAVLHAALTYGLSNGLKVFWVTAKTTQQRLVAETLQRIDERFHELETVSTGTEFAPGKTLPFRAVVLRARDKICPNLDEGGRVFCHEDYCRFAAGYSRKVRDGEVLAGLLELPVVEPDTVYRRGVAAEVCPYELSVEVAAEADVVIGDYNHIFDPRSVLRRFDLDRLASAAVLVVDEAHNLYNRGREYHSPAIDKRLALAALEVAEKRAASEQNALFLAIRRLLEVFSELEISLGAPSQGDAAIRIELDVGLLQELGRAVEDARTRHVIESRQRPTALEPGDDPVEELSRVLGRFVAALELAEEGVPMATLFELRRGRPRLRILCLDPSKPLGRRIESFRSVLAISATLEPPEFFRDVLGFPTASTNTLTLPSTFPRHNRRVLVDASIATTYRKRSRDAPAVARRIDEIAAQRTGNYLVFFSSHAYLQEVASHVDLWRIGADVMIQPRQLDEAGRDRILELLREPDSARILYAVQGGIFGEGVDYPGEMAIGVIVVGPGLPRYGQDEELVREHFEYLYQKGFEYAYLYPGMHRVIQSAGRLIRGPDDVGIVVLLGERFADSRYTRLFPEEWYEASPKELVSRDVAEDVRKFWEEVERVNRSNAARSVNPPPPNVQRPTSK